MAAVLAACGGSGGGGSTTPAQSNLPSVPANPQTTNTTTSAYGVLGTPTLRVAFVPAPGGVTPFLLENPLGKTITWGSAAAISGVPPTLPFSFPIDACTVDSNDLKAVCAGFGLTQPGVTDPSKSSRIAVLDLKKFVDTLQISDIGVQEFDSGAGNVPIRFSGIQCITCGIAADVGKQRFVTAGAGGYRVFNYGSTTATAVYDIPVGENFAFLPKPLGASYIVAPEYEPTATRTRKLRVVDVDVGRIYVWNKNTDSLADLGAEGRNFENQDVDAAAVDIKTGMIVLASEDSADFMLIDFGKAVFDNAALTFSAPFAFAKPNPATAVARLTDVAISTEQSILLSHGEKARAGETGANVGVTQLPTPSVPIGTLGVLDLNDANFNRSPCGAGYVFTGKGDPHGLSLYAGIDNGQRGLVIDANNTCAAVIDLVGAVGAPRSAGDPNRLDTTVPAVRDMVKFVRLR